MHQTGVRLPPEVNTRAIVVNLKPKDNSPNLPREAHVQTTQTIRGYRSVIDSLSSKLNTIQVTNSPPEQVEAFVANVSCGQCNLELDRDECDLAIRREEATYFVDGFSMDDLGAPHDEDGLCNEIRQAKVQGKAKDGRFLATLIEFLPVEEAAEEPFSFSRVDVNDTP